MAIARVTMEKSVANGPWVVEWYLDGDMQGVTLNVANIGAAVDIAKAYIAGAGGTPTKAVVTVNI